MSSSTTQAMFRSERWKTSRECDSLILPKLQLLNVAACVANFYTSASYEDFVAQFNANTFGALNVTRAMLPHFRQKRAGTILFNSSYFAWCGLPALSPYCGAKAALSAMVNCLQMEVAPLGIRCLCPEPGHFRTPCLNPAAGNLRAITSSKSDDYAEALNTVLGIRAAYDGNQPGDPQKAVELMIDLVKGEGCAAGKTVPLRLPIGRDSREAIKSACEEMLRTIEEWKDVIDSTDFVQT